MHENVGLVWTLKRPNQMLIVFPSSTRSEILQARTVDGQTYYLNHAQRMTQWECPLPGLFFFFNKNIFRYDCCLLAVHFFARCFPQSFSLKCYFY
jgi:hypothetical protein